MIKTSVLLLLGAAAAEAYVPTPMGISRAGRASAVSGLQMAQGPPPAVLPINKAKANAVKANKEQWGIEAPMVVTVQVGPAAPKGGAAPAPKAAAPAPKAAAPKKAAAGGDEATFVKGFQGVPSVYSRPGEASYPAEPAGQTVLGARGPRAPGHREMFGSKHAAMSLACAALLWQPISQAGMYTMEGGSLTKKSFGELETPGFGKVPTIDSFFPFSKNGFNAGPALFGPESLIVYENPLKNCGAYASSCHTFLDEIGDALKATPQEAPRSKGAATYSFPWMYEHAAWKK